MNLHFDPELLIEHTGPNEYLVYSPALHRWIKVDKSMRLLIGLIIREKGRMDPPAVAGEMAKNGCEVGPAQVTYQVSRLFHTGLFFECEKALQSAILDVKKQYAVRDDQKLELAYLHPTLRCNFHCWYCYNRKAPAHDAELGAGQWIEIIRQLVGQGVRAVIFTGGEVLLRDDFEEILAGAPLEKVYLEVLTNGSLLNSRLDTILPLVNRICISLDSLDAHTNGLNRSPEGFDDILAAIEKASRLNPRKVAVRAVVTRHNRDHVQELKRVLHEKYGVKMTQSWFIPNTPDEVELVPHIEDFIDPGVGEVPVGTALGGFRCGAASNTIAVGPDGTVYPCQSLLLEEFKITTILSESWYDDLLKSDIRSQFRGLSVEKMNHCGACSYRYFCGGGCPAISYKVYGKLTSHLDYFCNDLKMAARSRLIYGKVEWEDAI